MPAANLAIAAVLAEIADRLEIEDANPFRVRAYRNAARTVGEHPDDLAARIARGGTAAGLPGIGADLAGKIAEIAATGTCEALTRLRAEMPSAVTELLQVPGLGPKRVRLLWHELDLKTPNEVLQAAQARRIRRVHGFGEKLEANIEHAVAAHLAKERRMKLATAAEHASALVAAVRDVPGVGRVEVAGSFRRLRETVGDLDLIVTGRRGGAITAAFTHLAEVTSVLAAGPTRASVRLRCGLQVDLRVVPEASFGAALAYFTGSKGHNIALRRIAQERGLKLNEYGLYRGARRIAGDTEASIYAALDLPTIPPELREDHGEIEVARAGALPGLVELRDLRGDLHVHTDATDGRDTLAAMVAAAEARGLAYIAITDHSRRQAMSHGLDPTRLAAQGTAIDRHNAAHRGPWVLKGVEVDILEDGTLDLPDAALARLDVVVAAVHGQFNLTAPRQTARLLHALDNPHVTLLAYPTGRLIGEREPYDMDVAQVIRKAAARGVALEVNGQPERLDLTDTYCRMAKDARARLAITSDAHAASELAFVRWGIGQARRGWVEPADVLNTCSLPELLRMLGRGDSSGQRAHRVTATT